MAYEIPQNLKYEEKIVFGLTLPQAGWIALFGVLAAIVFLKTNLDFTIKAIICILILLLGLGFAFLDFMSHAKILWKYYHGIREAGYLDPKLNDFIKVKEIRDNALFLNDGSARAVIQIMPLHFSLLSVEEQRAIIGAYRDFLNSLDFSVQIVMRTVNLSLTEYFAALNKKVEKTRKTHLTAQLESFRKFMEEHIDKHHVKNRLFYAIIPAPMPNNTPNLLTGLTKKDPKSQLNQLEIRVKVCREKLKRANLSTKRLETDQLTGLIASFFEGFIEAQNDYLSHLTTLNIGSEKNETKKPREWFNVLGQIIKPNLE